MTIYFDLDGTLINIRRRHYHVYSEVVKNFSGKALSEGRYWDLKKKNKKLGEILIRSRMPKKAEHEFIKEFLKRIESNENLRKDVLIKNAKSALRSLKSNNTLFLITLRRSRKNLIYQLNTLGLLKYFNSILSSPNHSKVDLIRKELKFPAIIVGDSEEDINAAKNLKLISVAVLSGLRSKEFIASLKPNYIIPDVSYLPGLIKKVYLSK